VRRVPTSGGFLTTADPVRSSRNAAGDRALLALVILAAALLRVAAALHSRLWFDEIYTLWIARQPLPDLLRSVAADIHPPLHYVLVSAWRGIGGEGDLWIKSLSILTGVATVWVVYALGRDRFSRAAGLAGATLLAFHPAHIGFSQESRSYALLFLLLALAQWCAWRWIASRSVRDAVGFVLAAAAALDTHYLAAPVLALAALGMGWSLRADGARLRAWLVMQVAVGLLFAPQVPTLLVQLARLRADRWVQPASVAGLVNLFRLLAYNRSLAIVPLLALAAVPLLDRRTRAAAVQLWLISIVPALLLWALAMCGAGVYIERYMLFGLPAWCALLGAGALALPGRWVRIAVLLGLGFLAARGALRHEAQPEAARMAQVESFLHANVRPGELVVHADAHSLLFSRHYPLDPGEHVIYLRNDRLPYYEGDLVIPPAWRIGPADLDRLAAARPRWWAIATRYGFAAADAETTDLARAAGARVWSIDRATIWRGGAAADSARR